MITAALLACALNVAPTTMDAIVTQESGGNQYAIHVNKLTGRQPRPTSALEAVAAAQRYVAMGYSVDLGYAQLNSRNLPKLGYTLEDAFEPCRNLAGGAKILSAFYAKAVLQFGEGQRALMAALSGYNSGSLTAGFSSGYVGRYYINASVLAAPSARSAVAARPFLTTIAYDRPGLDLRLNRD